MASRLAEKAEKVTGKGDRFIWPSCIFRVDDRSPLLAAFLDVVRAYHSRSSG